MMPMNGAAAVLACFLWSSPATEPAGGTPSPAPSASAEAVTKERALAIARAAAIPGAGPLVVLREGGAATFLSTSVPPDKAIAEYEKTWRRTVERKPPS
jgi:hypothetical protein